MCLNHYLRYYCGYEQLRLDVTHWFCADVLKTVAGDSIDPCRNVLITYTDDPRRCNRCLACALDNELLNKQQEQPQHARVVCPRHLAVFGQQILLGDTPVLEDPQQCSACRQQVADEKEDDRRRDIAKAVYQQGTKDKRNSWEESSRRLKHEAEELVKVRQARSPIQKPKSISRAWLTRNFRNCLNGHNDQVESSATTIVERLWIG